MFRLDIDEEITLIQIQESHAEELFRLTDKSRKELREWLGTKRAAAKLW